jgi:hypothetical protein
MMQHGFLIATLTPIPVIAVAQDTRERGNKARKGKTIE